MQNNIILGDCLEKMRDIPDRSINMILCDLPYGTTACKWDIIIPFEPLWEQYKRIITNNSAIVLFGTQPFSSLLINSNFSQFKYSWIWIKNIHSGFQYAKYRPMQKHEDILVFGNKTNYYPQMSIGEYKYSRSGKKETKRPTDNVIGDGIKYNLSLVKTNQYYPTTQLEFNCVPRPNSVHPTQKPVELCEYLIKTYTKENELVLDNCAGSGTTGIAALNTNRRFILIEKDETYYNLCVKRISMYGNKVP